MTSTQPAAGTKQAYGLCNICGTFSTLRCSSCSLVFYCGKDHQVKDWKRHKSTCSTCELVETGTGSIVKAKKDIEKALMTVFELSPLLVVPVLLLKRELSSYRTLVGIVGDTSQVPNHPLVPCFGCYQPVAYGGCIIDPDRGLCLGKCTKCGWPVHNYICEKSPDHQNECEFLVQHGLKIMGVSGLPKDFHCVSILRALLLKLRNKPGWHALWKMPVPAEAAAGKCETATDAPPDHGNTLDIEREMVKDFIYNGCGFSKSFINEEELERLRLIIKCNRLESTHPMNYNKAFVDVIYSTAYHGRGMSHSCLPNCFVEMDPATLKGTFKTLRPIKAGETLEINYQGKHDEMVGLSMFSRNFHLQLGLGCPPCTCPRCADPTENGTYFSAVRCTNKKPKCTGYLLPVEPTSTSQHAVWKCTQSSCSTKTTQEGIEAIVIQFPREYYKRPQDSPLRFLADGQRIIEKYESRVFHPNHFKVLQGYLNQESAIVRIIEKPQQYFGQTRSVVPDTFKYHRYTNPNFMATLKRILEFYDVIQPGAFWRRGITLFFYTLLRVSKLADEFRIVLSKSSGEQNGVVLTSLSEVPQIAADFNESLQIMSSNPILQLDWKKNIGKPLLLQRAHLLCLSKALKPVMESVDFDWKHTAYHVVLDVDWEKLMLTSPTEITQLVI